MWIARDKNNELYLYWNKPVRATEEWLTNSVSMGIDDSMFSNLKWEDEPVEVNIFTNEFIQEFGDACYKQGEQDACHFEYGEYPEGNLTIKEYVDSKNKTI